MESLWNDNTVDVDTGEVRVSVEAVTLRAIAIGSCVAVVVYDRTKKIGGLAHVMLPGRSEATTGKNRTKYAEDAIDVVLDSVLKLGADRDRLEVSLVGGANVLQEGDIPDKVTQSVKGYLKALNLGWCKERLGGIERRSVFLDISSGRVFITQGDGAAKEL